MAQENVVVVRFSEPSKAYQALSVPASTSSAFRTSRGSRTVLR